MDRLVICSGSILQRTIRDLRQGGAAPGSGGFGLLGCGTLVVQGEEAGEDLSPGEAGRLP